MRLIKFTDKYSRDANGIQWGVGIEHVKSGSEVIGAYKDLLVGLMLNPIHANFHDPRAWMANGSDKIKTDHGLMVGVTRLMTLHKIEIPRITSNHRVRFAILCSAKIYNDPAFIQWAQDWLDGRKRPSKEVIVERFRRVFSEDAEETCCASVSSLEQAAIISETLIAADLEVHHEHTSAALYAAKAVENAARTKYLNLPVLARRAVSQKRIVFKKTEP